MNRIFVKMIEYRKRERVFILVFNIKKKFSIIFIVYLVSKCTITYFQRKLMLIKNYFM